jgi:Tannase and feruloyl esterase
MPHRGISALMDSTDPDLSSLASRGGRLILKENMSDFAHPFAGVDYYKRVVAKIGQSDIDAFMRFYVTAGASHGGTGVSSIDAARLPRGIDLLEVIDAWVDRGALRTRLSRLPRRRSRRSPSLLPGRCADIPPAHATTAPPHPKRRRTLPAA